IKPPAAPLSAPAAPITVPAAHLAPTAPAAPSPLKTVSAAPSPLSSFFVSATDMSKSMPSAPSSSQPDVKKTFHPRPESSHHQQQVSESPYSGMQTTTSGVIIIPPKSSTRNRWDVQPSTSSSPAAAVGATAAMPFPASNATSPTGLSSTVTSPATSLALAAKTSTTLPATSSALAAKISTTSPATSSVLAAKTSTTSPATSSVLAAKTSTTTPATSSALAAKASTTSPATSSVLAAKTSTTTPATSSALAAKASTTSPATSSALAAKISTTSPATSSALAAKTSTTLPATSSALAAKTSTTSPATSSALAAKTSTISPATSSALAAKTSTSVQNQPAVSQIQKPAAVVIQQQQELQCNPADIIQQQQQASHPQGQSPQDASLLTSSPSLDILLEAALKSLLRPSPTISVSPDRHSRPEEQGRSADQVINIVPTASATSAFADSAAGAPAASGTQVLEGDSSDMELDVMLPQCPLVPFASATQRTSSSKNVPDVEASPQPSLTPPTPPPSALVQQPLFKGMWRIKPLITSKTQQQKQATGARAETASASASASALMCFKTLRLCSKIDAALMSTNNPGGTSSSPQSTNNPGGTSSSPQSTNNPGGTSSSPQSYGAPISNTHHHHSKTAATSNAPTGGRAAEFILLSEGLDPAWPICKFDVRGTCKDRRCSMQHLSDGTLDHNQVQQELRLRQQACQSARLDNSHPSEKGFTMGRPILVGSPPIKDPKGQLNSRAVASPALISAPAIPSSSSHGHKLVSNPTPPAGSTAVTSSLTMYAPQTSVGVHVDAARLRSCGLYVVDAAAACRGLPALVQLHSSRGRAVPLETRLRMAQDVPTPVYAGSCIPAFSSLLLSSVPLPSRQQQLPWLSAASPGAGMPLKGLDWMSLSATPAPCLTDSELRERDRPAARTDRYFPVPSSSNSSLAAAAVPSSLMPSQVVKDNSSSSNGRNLIHSTNSSGSSVLSLREICLGAAALAAAHGGTPVAWIRACLKMLGYDGPGHSSTERAAALEVLLQGLAVHPEHPEILRLHLTLTGLSTGFSPFLEGVKLQIMHALTQRLDASSSKGGSAASPRLSKWGGQEYQLSLALVSVEGTWKEAAKMLQKGMAAVLVAASPQQTSPFFPPPPSALSSTITSSCTAASFASKRAACSLDLALRHLQLLCSSGNTDLAGEWVQHLLGAQQKQQQWQAPGLREGAFSVPLTWQLPSGSEDWGRKHEEACCELLLQALLPFPEMMYVLWACCGNVLMQGHLPAAAEHRLGFLQRPFPLNLKPMLRAQGDNSCLIIEKVASVLEAAAGCLRYSMQAAAASPEAPKSCGSTNPGLASALASLMLTALTAPEPWKKVSASGALPSTLPLPLRLYSALRVTSEATQKVIEMECLLTGRPTADNSGEVLSPASLYIQGTGEYDNPGKGGAGYLLRAALCGLSVAVEAGNLWCQQEASRQGGPIITAQAVIVAGGSSASPEKQLQEADSIPGTAASHEGLPSEISALAMRSASMYRQACTLLDDMPCRLVKECMAVHAGLLRTPSSQDLAAGKPYSRALPIFVSSPLWKERGWLQCALLSDPDFLRQATLSKPDLPIAAIKRQSVAEAALLAAAAAVMKLCHGDLPGCLENTRAALSVSRQLPTVTALVSSCILKGVIQLCAFSAAAARSSAVRLLIKEVVPEVMHLARQQQLHVRGLSMPLRSPLECLEQGGHSADTDALCTAVLGPGLLPDLVTPLCMLQEVLHLLDRKEVMEVCEIVADLGHGSPAAATLLVAAAQQLPEDKGWQCWAIPLVAGLLISAYPPAPAEVWSQAVALCMRQSTLAASELCSMALSQAHPLSLSLWSHNLELQAAESSGQRAATAGDMLRHGLKPSSA
ncbi:hypothetical protein CEUSTIGMA_g1283.t1, partial [Chlamydomonas eustigma]